MASETYIGSIPKVLRPAVSGYKFIEKKIQNMIWDTFRLHHPTEQENRLIQQIDTDILVNERNQLMTQANTWKPKVFKDLNFKITKESTSSIEKLFINIYCGLRFPALNEKEYSRR